MTTQADGYQTLSEKEQENQEKEKRMKKELAEKKKKLKKMQEQRKRDEKMRKEQEEKKAKEEKQIEQIELSAELEGVGGKKEAPISMDSSAMNAYSLAVAHVAENSEPDLPANYGTETEKQDGASMMTQLADKEISSLFSKKGGKERLDTGGLELIQLNA